jgi:hypothetical protein
MRGEFRRLLSKGLPSNLPRCIDAVWVFSGPGTYDEPLSPGEKDYMCWMDRQRILSGITIVRRITAKRAKKKLNQIRREDVRRLGPLFIYNGTPEENNSLQNALKRPLFPLPAEKVVIVKSIRKDKKGLPITNTLEQVESFPKELIGKGKPISHAIAIVSHAFHFPRILRYLEEHRILPAEIKVYAIPLKTATKAMRHYKKAEIEKVWKYFKKGDLAFEPFPIEN